MVKSVASDRNVSGAAPVAERVVPPPLARGAPTPTVTSAEAEAMRRDPDGPDNIHNLGEPCQTAEECKETFLFDAKYNSLFHQSRWKEMVKAFWGDVSRRPLVTRHAANVSHVQEGGRLDVVAASLPEEIKRMNTEPGFISASQAARIMLASTGKDYRLVQNGSISDAILKERELSGEPLKYVFIRAHGAEGRIYEQSGSETSLPYLFRDIMPALAPGATVDFASCNVAQTQRVRELLQVIANRYGVVIRANGNMGFGSDDTAKRHAYVFTPNPKGETDYRNTRIYKEYKAEERQEALDTLRASGGAR